MSTPDTLFDTHEHGDPQSARGRGWYVDCDCGWSSPLEPNHIDAIRRHNVHADLMAGREPCPQGPSGLDGECLRTNHTPPSGLRGAVVHQMPDGHLHAHVMRATPAACADWLVLMRARGRDYWFAKWTKRKGWHLLNAAEEQTALDTLKPRPMD